MARKCWLISVAMMALLVANGSFFEARAAATLEYPEILTNKNWQKKKGKIAKLAGKTGIGAAMDDLKSTYDRINWLEYDVKGNFATNKGLSVQAVEDKRNEVGRKWASDVKPLREKALDLHRLADDLAKKWKKKKTIPKSSRKHCEEVAKAALNFATVARDWDEWQKSFDKEVADIQEKQSQAAKQLPNYLVSLDKYIKECEKNPTKETFTGGAKTGLYQNIRGIQAAIANIPVLNDQFGDKWREMAAASYLKKSTENEESIKKALKEVESERKKLEQAVKSM